jgi:malonyl-CoA decarboxylase
VNSFYFILIDDVARFHLRNGAIFYNINWMGNPSENGLKTSAGMMINYLYDIEQLEKNSTAFVTNQDSLPIGPMISNVLSKV